MLPLQKIHVAKQRSNLQNPNVYRIFMYYSVRVSNELGSGHPRKARFSVLVIGVSSLLIGLVFTLILAVSRGRYPAIFTTSSEVQQVVQELTPLLGISMILTTVQYGLLGTYRFASRSNLLSN